MGKLSKKGKDRASRQISREPVIETTTERTEAVSNVENPPLGPGVDGGAGLQNPPLGPGVGSRIQNPPLGLGVGSGGGHQNPPLGPGVGIRLQNPPLGPGVGGGGHQNPPLGPSVGDRQDPARSFQIQPQHQEYNGHRIELRAREAERAAALELLIDGQPVRYGQFPDGLYFLHEYAFDWTDNLMDLARRLIDYRSRAHRIRREQEH